MNVYSIFGTLQNCSAAMKILVIIHPAVGPLNSSFYLIKLLKKSNHELLYLIPQSNQNLKEIVNNQGFEVVFFNPVNDINEGFVSTLVNEYGLNGIILDGDQLNFAILFSKHAIGKVFINNCVQTDKERRIPPYYSLLIPRDTILSYIQIEISWFRCFANKKLNYWRDIIKTNNKDDFYHRKLSKSVGFPLKRYAKYDRAWLYSLSIYPEFFLYPIEFDFPRNLNRKNQFFIGPMIDIDRKEIGFKWSDIKNTNPIIYCALGTLAHIYFDNYISFLKKIMHVLENRPDINLIISIGSHCDPEAIKSSKSNIYVYRNVPQIEILKKASMMITHGGLNSIKECIHFCIPMLIYPLNSYNDQKGNAARVTYHKLGKMGNIRKDSLLKIASDIDDVYTNKIYRENTCKMQAIFMEYKRNEELVLLKLESYLKPENGMR